MLATITSTVSYIHRESEVLSEAHFLTQTVDDCWSMKNGRVNGHIAVNKTRFPDGIDGLAKKIHDMDLRLGIYSSKYELLFPR